MDRIAAILRFQWRAYWRRVQRAGNMSTNNVGVLVLLGVMSVFKYLQQLPGIAAQLAQGKTARYETLLMAVFLVWMFPAMGESRRSITSGALLHTPLTSRELFFIRVGSIFISPVTWAIAAGSLALCYPISKAAHPATGVAALLMFLLFSLGMSLTITHVLSSAFMRRLLLGLVLAGSVVFGGSWLVYGRVSATAFSWWPNQLTANAAVASRPFGSLTILAVMTAAVFGLSLWTFTGSLQPGGDRRSQRFTVLGLIPFPGKFGGLFKKDLRYFSRLLDIYFALPIVILLNIYLASSPEPSAPIFRAVLVALFLPFISMISNCFGLDSPLEFDRYTLLPLSGRDILLSKNLAFGAVLVISFGAIFPLALWKLGAGVAVLGFVEVVLMGLAYLSWGNWMSLRDPYKMQFYRFSAGGSLPDAIMGMLFGSLPGAIMAYLLYWENYGAIWKIMLVILLYLALYYLSVTRAGRRLEERREDIRHALS
jgi:hypothetical protein